MSAYGRQLVRAAVGLLLALAGFFASASSAAADPPSCGGEVPPPKPDGSAWTCTFDDEFDASTGDATTLDRTRWTPQLTTTSGYTTGTNEAPVCYIDSPNNISVSDGALHVTVRKEAAPIDCGGTTTSYTGGMVTSGGNFSQTYGRFEVRALLPQASVAGLQETLWLWPVRDTYGPWPASGEVDFSEFYSQYYWLDVPYIHYNYDASTVDNSTDTNVVTAHCHIDYTQFNDYAVQWAPGTFTITVNGAPCLTDHYIPNNGLTSPQPFDQPFFILLTQALGEGTNAFDPSRTPLPATTSVDYVRVWK
jgi:beta-glucanase (GH16 family)